jgi:DNA-binding NtrC family response regulator
MSQPLIFFRRFLPRQRDLEVKEELQRLVLQMYRSGLRYSEAVREFQRTFVATVLREANANQVRAANRLDIHRNTLRRQIRDLGLDIKALRLVPRRPPLSERLVEQKRQRAAPEATRRSS